MAGLRLRAGVSWLGVGLVLGLRTMEGPSSSEDCLHAARLNHGWKTYLPISRLHARTRGIRRLSDFLCEFFPDSQDVSVLDVV